MQFVDMSIKVLEFHEEACIGKVAVNNTNRICWINRGLQHTADLLECAQMERRDIATDTD